MKKVLKGCLISACLVVMTAGTGFGWAWGTHAFIADGLGKKRLPANSNEIYGSVAPDAFNFLFYSPELLETLAPAAHYGAEVMWDLARNQPEREFAYGFASHNEAWGADETAHIKGTALDVGYVIVKANYLLNDMGFDAILANLGLPLEARYLVAHVLVESAIDLDLAKNHPELGVKLERAGLHRNQLFPKMMVAAFRDEAPVGWSSDIERQILETEEGFRGDIIAYGKLLQQPELVARDLMAALLVQQAAGYLSMLGLPPFDTATLKGYANIGLGLAMDVCSDYMAELEATKASVAQGMYDNVIDY